MNPCKLCHLGNDLQESHYLPRFAYKATRASQLKNQNPVVITPGRGVRQGQHQMKAHVFCADCEQRFNNGGEKWVLQRLPRDHGEPCRLQDDLLKETPFFSGPGLDLYAGVKIAAFDMDKLVYFAASIFWRGAVHRWEIDGQRVARVELHDHEEQLRLFLLGQGPFPADVWLTTVIWPFKPVFVGAIPPKPEYAPSWNRYWFYICGLAFVLNFGSAVPLDIKQRCSQNTSQRVVTVEREFGIQVWKFLRTVAEQEQTDQSREMMREIEKIRGKGSAPMKPPVP